MSTLSIMNTGTDIIFIDITTSDPLYWSVLYVGLEKIICNSFDDYLVPLYECMFSRIRLWLPLSDFEVVVIKHLKVSSS